MVEGNMVRRGRQKRTCPLRPFHGNNGPARKIVLPSDCLYILLAIVMTPLAYFFVKRLVIRARARRARRANRKGAQ